MEENALENSKAVLNSERITLISKALENKIFVPFKFDTPEFFPPVGHPRTIEYFFKVVLHQFGFWYLDNERWSGSMFAIIDNQLLKGSDFIWRSATKSLMNNEEEITNFLDEEGNCPLPMLKEHRDLTEKFSRFIFEYPAEKIIEDSNSSKEPLKRLMEILSNAPGYCEDPYRKKAMLLAMSIANRPEQFLKGRNERHLEGWEPVVDYHIQRTSLRTGMVEILDEDLRKRNIERRVIEAKEEDSIRRATYDAMIQLSNRSGLSHAAIDYLFFQARSRCPEAGEPRCAECLFNAVCAMRKDLFQPVFRTTAY